MLLDKGDAYSCRQYPSNTHNDDSLGPANYTPRVCCQECCCSSSTMDHAKYQNVNSQNIVCNNVNLKSTADRSVDEIMLPYNIYDWHTTSMKHSSTRTATTALKAPSKAIKVPLTSVACCNFLVARCAAIILISLCLLLTAAQGVSGEPHTSSNATKQLAAAQFSANLSDIQRIDPGLLNDRAKGATDKVDANSNRNSDSDRRSPPADVQSVIDKELTFGPEPTQAEVAVAAAAASAAPASSSSASASSAHSSKVDLATGRSGGSFSSRSVSMNRNSLISGDNMLQRQLREKAKQDSLESIKMHILMRLNLKKLPNITKPIQVPQNILEKFYKDYNASLSSGSVWRRGSASGSTSPRNGLSNSQEYFTSATESDVTSNVAEISREYISDSGNTEFEEQSDDANAFNEYKWISKFGLDGRENTAANDKHFEPDDEEEYDSILSHINSIYVFPEQPHMRHNRKADVLRFKFDSSYSDISYATLHLYLRGWDWISTHLPELFEEIGGEPQRQRDIVVSVHRAIRRGNSTNITHKAKVLEFRHKIPTGLGQWVNIDLKPLFGRSMNGPNKSQEILIKGVESWMKPLVVTTDNTSKNPLTVHIEIGSQKKHRRKRSIYMDCAENDQDVRCCRYPLKVNFTTFGWQFVVAPTSFDAYFCSGDCNAGFLEQYPHTHVASLTTSASPCCSPTKMSSLSLLYFDYNHNLVLSVIPNMSVEGCSCS
ncbi:uncharacterized protein LOC115628015 [Scaptodrosophila lebanonensis]|uniref:Uncharacterized protein LOC115628015 n=1 Tax=Drosophila lebanonensis TaxID=7225 RepID=A0A6J2TW80_DROLE|nr:uncharacterized protein LOC115628015 [Scaptodrosophila lebanonensis]XP_030379805.1 uncharacterized protein LOC115628015 [Scaptodrosophila lebanonensis]